MLLALCTTQVKKRLTRRFSQKKKNKVTKNLLEGDSSPDPPNQLALKVNASIQRTTSVNADNPSLFLLYVD